MLSHLLPSRNPFSGRLISGIHEVIKQFKKDGLIDLKIIAIFLSILVVIKNDRARAGLMLQGFELKKRQARDRLIETLFFYFSLHFCYELQKKKEEFNLIQFTISEYLRNNFFICIE